MRLLQGDCLGSLDAISDGVIDMVLTDPPYSSGGLYPGERKRPTKEKYADPGFDGAARFPDFSGDNMDQRSFGMFMRMVLSRCRQKTRPGGICAVFTDWRQLASMTDALQLAGWVYRGIVVWDKGNSRPIAGRFRNDCEYIAWGTNGERKVPRGPGIAVYKGCHHIPIVQSRDRHHQAEKPVSLLKELLKIVPEGGSVLDPFMGSGSTGVACQELGLDFIGIELDEIYFDIAKERIGEACQTSGEVL